MTRTECVMFLQDLEQRFDAGSLRFQGIRIWPLVRVKIGEWIVRNEVRPGAAKGYTPRTMSGQLGTLFSGCLNYASWWWRMPRADILIHSSDRLRLELHDVIHDRFTDPLVAAASTLDLGSLVIDRDQAAGPTAPMAFRATRFDISAAIEACALLHWRRPFPLPDAVPGLAGLLAHVALSVATDERYLMDQLHSFTFYLRFHRRLLRLSKPKCVFVICWYTMENMAIAQACHEAGVRCVEMQHGVQGPAHIAYGNWTAIGPEGYSLMPHIFWCWDQLSAEHINKWAADTPHRALPLGHPWQTMSPAPDMPSPWKPDGRKRILFTAQPLQELLPNVLLEAIRATINDAQWMIRVHPNRPEMLPTIIADLRTAGLSDAVVIDDPRSSPLTTVLEGCSLHVTSFSSVVIEASAAGVPSTAVHPNAAGLFPEYLASGALSMALEAEQLIAKVRSATALERQNIALPPLSERLRAAMETPLAA
ncbi:MAG: hypothetical protein ABI599_10325 [Flavobacteriales bacterium]